MFECKNCKGFHWIGINTAAYALLYYSVPSEFLNINRLVPFTWFNSLCAKSFSAKPVSWFQQLCQCRASKYNVMGSLLLLIA